MNIQSVIKFENTIFEQYSNQSFNITSRKFYANIILSDINTKKEIIKKK